MKTFNIARALRAALLCAAVTGSAGIARADIKDYEFKLIEPTVAVGKDKIVTVQLANKKTGKPMSDAVIFATRLDMAPEGVRDIATMVAREPGGEHGSHRLKSGFARGGAR